MQNTSPSLTVDNSASRPALFSQPRVSYAIIIGFVLLSAALRLFFLGKVNFWYDEIASFAYASNLSVFDVHPPFYYSILHLLLNFSTSEFVLRLPSVIADLVSVVLVYAIVHQLFNLRIAVIATLLTSLSPLLIWHAQDARMYSQAVTFSLLTVYCYLRLLNKQSLFNWICYTLSATLAIYTHLYTIFIPVTLSLHLFLFHRNLFWRWTLANLAVALLYTPWLIIFIDLPAKQIGSSRSTNIFNLFYNYYVFSTGYSLGPTVNDLREQNLKVLVPYIPLIIPIALTTVALIVQAVRYLWRTSRETGALILLWVILPVVLAVVIPIFRPSMVFNVRYVLFSAPAFLCLLAIGIGSLGKYAGRLAAIIVILYSFIGLYHYYFDDRYAKEDVRAAANYITQQQTGKDHILVVTIGSVFKWYYQADDLVTSNTQPGTPAELVDQATANADSVWLVEARPWQTDPDNEIKSYLEAHYTLLESEIFPGVEVYKYCVANCAS